MQYKKAWMLPIIDLSEESWGLALEASMLAQTDKLCFISEWKESILWNEMQVKIF